MKRSWLSVAVALSSFAVVETRAQLLISELFPNPPTGTDSPFEWVELVAASDIDFSITPYSVVFANVTGTLLPTNGWATGLGVTYGFNINAGTVSRGDVVYVGGSGMTPTGTKLRVINTATTFGDGFGNTNASGVLGNGGNNADAVAVFSTAIDNVTSSLAPVDAIFFGNTNSAGGAVWSGGAGGFVLPVNDYYAGGFLQSNSFAAIDPGAGTLVAAGSYNTDLQAWEGLRTWVAGTLTDGSSSLQLVPVPEPSSFVLFGLGGLAGGYYLARRRRD